MVEKKETIMYVQKKGKTNESERKMKRNKKGSG